MPNRILRDGIIESERVNKLSVGAEIFYRRLMSRADDHGRYHANLNLLRAACYPLQLDRVSLSNVRDWLTECGESPSLVREYSVDGKNYLEIINFGQRVRSSVSKFPDPSRTIDSESRTSAARATTPTTTTTPHTTPHTVAIVGDFEERFSAAWDRHKKHRGGVTRQMVAQRTLEVDWDAWDARHVPFCEFWDRAGWTTCAVTMLEWWENGMPLPPPETVSRTGPQKESRSDEQIRVMKQRAAVEFKKKGIL